MAILSDDKKDRKAYQAEYYARNKEKVAERKKAARLAQQDEANTAQKERYHTDPDYKESRREVNAKAFAKRMELAQTDPVAQQKRKEYNAKRREQHRERYANDPEYRRKHDEHNAMLREKRRAKKEQTQANAQVEDADSGQ